ncbi:hypothetical protein T492DRAFT_899617 [Pavlovales sp. CCMP2436]|nr:hypothetical protein T492DRAFT_899617 [Pavlovales sp. CCMP2436]
MGTWTATDLAAEETEMDARCMYVMYGERGRLEGYGIGQGVAAHKSEPINVLLATEGDVLLARFRAIPGVVAVKVTEDVISHKVHRRGNVQVTFLRSASLGQDDRKQIKVQYSNARPTLQHVIVLMPTVAGLELVPQLWPAPEPELQFEPEPEPEPQPQPQLAPARRDSHGRAPPTQELPDAKREPDAGGENDGWRSWTFGQYSRMEGMLQGCGGG